MVDNNGKNNDIESCSSYETESLGKTYMKTEADNQDIIDEFDSIIRNKSTGSKTRYD